MSPRASGDSAAPTPQPPEFDRVVHEPARLTILAHLFAVESADFTFLQRHTGLTGGNLSSHMKRLQSAGYVEVAKDFVDDKPHTMLRLTGSGRDAFEAYREQMRRLLRDAE